MISNSAFNTEPDGQGRSRVNISGHMRSVERQVRARLDHWATKWDIFHVPVAHLARQVSTELSTEVTPAQVQLALSAIAESGDYIKVAESQGPSARYPKGLAAAWASGESAETLTEEEIELAVPHMRYRHLRGMGRIALDGFMSRTKASPSSDPESM